jgi:hypothetical protein
MKSRRKESRQVQTQYTHRPLPSHKSQSGHLTASLATASPAVWGIISSLSASRVSSCANNTDALLLATVGMRQLLIMVNPETDDMARSARNVNTQRWFVMMIRCIVRELGT